MPKIITLPGDGIGPEVTAAAVAVLREVAPDLTFEEHLLGGEAIEATGQPFPQATQDALKGAGAVLLGTVDGPQNSPWNALARHLRPESGLLQLRKLLGVYANLRPVRVQPGLEHLSPLKPELARGVDILIVRELLGGIYFDQDRKIDGDTAYNTMRYTTSEVERIARVAFWAAEQRKGRVTSVDKANVLEVSELWRRDVSALKEREYPRLHLNHEYVDSVAMLIVTNAGAVVPPVPVAVKVKLSVPKNPAFGVYVALNPVTTTTPFVGRDAIAIELTFPLTTAARLMVTGVKNGVFTLTPDTPGKGTFAIKNVTAAEPVPEAFIARTVALKVPTALGLPEISPLEVLTDMPGASPVALKLVGPLDAVIW